MGRAPCCDKANVKRGPWSPEEDDTLKRYVQTHGTAGNWIALPQKAGLRRCGKSCRLRWLNYLRPDIKHGGFTEEEDNIICSLYSQMGSRWSLIASQLPGRTDNDVKNYWNTKLKKKLLAGKLSFPSKTNKIPTDDPPPPPPPPLASTPSVLPCLPKTETYNLGFSASQTQISATLPITTDHVGYGLNLDTQSLGNLDPIQFSCPQLSHVSEFGPSVKDSRVIVTSSSSQDQGSNFSGDPSSSLSMENKCVSMAGINGGDHHVDAAGILMDFGFGFPYDVVNGLWFQEKASEVPLISCYPNSADFAYADIKPQGAVDQSVTNQYS